MTTEPQRPLSADVAATASPPAPRPLVKVAIADLNVRCWYTRSGIPCGHDASYGVRKGTSTYWRCHDHRYLLEDDVESPDGTSLTAWVPRGQVAPDAVLATRLVDAAPVLPYAGTSGWSGSDTSRERAENNDRTERTTAYQRAALLSLAGARRPGMTWAELSRTRGWHHGTASSVLSVLHMAGRIARLKERRGKSAIYVLPEYVDGRETAPHGRKRPTLSPEERAVLDKVDGDLEHFGQAESGDVRVLAAALRRIA